MRILPHCKISFGPFLFKVLHSSHAGSTEQPNILTQNLNSLLLRSKWPQRELLSPPPSFGTTKLKLGGGKRWWLRWEGVKQYKSIYKLGPRWMKSHRVYLLKHSIPDLLQWLTANKVTSKSFFWWYMLNACPAPSVFQWYSWPSTHKHVYSVWWHTEPPYPPTMAVCQMTFLLIAYSLSNSV